MDFLAYGNPSPDAAAAAFRTVCDAEVERDGLTFVAESVAAEPIRYGRGRNLVTYLVTT